MGVRPYRLYDNKNWTSYSNLKAAMWDLCVKLYNMNHLDLIHTGKFEETEFLGNTFYKQYVITLLFPYTEFKIKKTTKGDFNQEEFKTTLRLVEKMFNERIQHKN